MKKKFLTFIFTLTAMLMCIFGFSACNKVEFKVNFVVDGAVYATINTNGEEIIKMPENPTKEDYTFDGWYWDKDSWQTPFTANSLLDAPLSSDMNVYCKWKANTVNVESVNLDKTELSLHEGDVEYLTATILPTNATDTSVVWESSNATIATVTGGKVTAIRIGSATITATTSDGGKIAACNVYVEPITVESVSLNHTALSLLRGESKTLTATVSPSNATEKGVLWHSANSSIVTVENGTVKAVGYGTVTITATTIDGNKTATCEIEVIQDKITFNTLTVDGENVCGEVSNATTTFSFIREITEHGNATYQVYKEITCETLIASKSIALSVGDNTVYVLQTVGKDLKLYTVTVRRRPMYDVIFNVNGGTAVEKQVIEEGYLATEPITTRTGYTFKAWDYDFTQPITKNTEITAIWTANTNTAYKVEYYLQNLENDNYTLKETVNKTGTTDTTAKAEIKTFAHFTYKASATDSGNIAPNGSTVLKVYYTRNVYTISVNNTSCGSITNEGKYKYGKKLTSTASVKLLGYDFVGWYSGEELLSTDATYTFTVDKNVTANFAVKAEMSNFNFTSTATACSITGLKDKTVTEIVVPDYVTRINSSAFSDCSVLTKITLPFVGAMKSATSASSSTVFGYIFGESSYTGGMATKQYYSSSSYTTYYIPTSLKKVTVTGGKLLYSAFNNCSSLTSVIIGDSVTSIGAEAFSGCSSLTSVEIGDSVTSIGSSAFKNCSSLTSVVVPNGVTSIGEGAFRSCTSLAEITLPFVGRIKYASGYESVFGYIFGYTTSSSSNTISGTTCQYSVYVSGNYKYYHYYIPTSLKSVTVTGYIGKYAFENCSSLTSISIPDSMTSIGSSAFKNCSSLTSVYYTGTIESWCNISFGDYYANPLCNGASLYLNNELVTALEIPNTITEIKAYAFDNCDSLTEIVIPDSVTSIGERAFSGCSSLTSITIPDSVTSIGAGAFGGCSSLTSVVIGDGVTSIVDSVFYNCSSLTSVIIPESVTSIGAYAFENCSSLTSVVIPDSVTSIGAYAFENCSSLTIYCEAASRPSGWHSYWNGSNCPVVWNCHNNDVASCGYIYVVIDSIRYGIKDGVAMVVQQARNIQTANIPASITYQGIVYSVTSIGYEAFYGCNSLTSVEIPDSVTSIGSYAFYNCDSLTSIPIPDSVTSIGYQAFYSCNSLTSIEIPDSVTSIGSYAFAYCDGLTNIEIPDSVTSIGYSAFYGCNSLTSITIPFIGASKNGTSDTHFGYIFGESGSSDNDDYVPSSLKKVTITGGTIRAYAFYDCDRLTSVVIGDSVTSIGECAFYSCNRLTSVVIGDSVTSIGERAFSGCSSLTRVYYKGTAEEWLQISIGSYNDRLTSATRYYNGETKPISSGNYWHYVNGVPTKW